MKSLHVCPDGLGNPRIEALALPFLAPGPTATAADQDRSPDPQTMTAAASARAVTRRTGLHEVIPGGSPRRLLIVVSGTLQVIVPDMRARVSPGDALFLDLPGSSEHPAVLRPATDCRYVEVGVSDAWLPTGTVPPALDEGRRTPLAEPRLLRMYSDEGLAHLEDLADLFSQDCAPQEVTALSFVSLSPGMRSGWHTEPGVSLLIVLAGGFELEVGGVGGRRTLRAGDICLVEDFAGQGHRSSSDGETRFAVLSLPTDHRWPRKP